MNKVSELFAVPFDTYQSSKTTKGVLYNIIDSSNKNTILQTFVTTPRYTNHDLLLTNISGAPSSCRNALRNRLDEIYGKDMWNMFTRFSIPTTKRTERLQEFKFSDACVALKYSSESNDVEIIKPITKPDNGI